MSQLLRWSAVRQNTTTYRAFQLTNTTGQVRHASLSGIHRGLRRSTRAGSQNGRATSPNSRIREDGLARRPDFKPRLTESRGRSPSRNVPTKPDAFANKFNGAMGGREHHFKPKKAFQKMKEREQEEEEGGRKSRSKRFNNPEYSFGKKSMVYQLNRSELKDKVSKLLDKEGMNDDKTEYPRPGSAWRDLNRDASRPRRDGDRNSTSQRRDGDWTSARPRHDGDRNSTAQRRDGDWASARPRRDGDWKATTFRKDGGRDTMRQMRDGVRREFERDGAAPRRQTRGSDDDSSANRPAEFPLSIQYTTAASQFLFGRSVVKAALRNSQRKLYNLYVYQGSNKKDTKDDTWIVSMAEKKGIKVKSVYEADQKLLDKMSKGRPHNGLVLEASPLPQLPLVSLGGLSADSNGYTVSVAHQSKEDLEINGTEGSIPCKQGQPRPLVLLLNEILDPGNLGAILRTACFLGVSAVAITDRTSSSITSTVLKAAAGAAEEIRLFTVEDPGRFLSLSQEAGWTSYAAVAPTLGSRSNRQWTPEYIEDFKPLEKEPCILVLGNEGSGLPYDIRKKATHEVTIPRVASTASSVDSLNVSVAAALLCNSFFRGVRQRDPLTLTERLHIDARKADGGEPIF
ncbi:RNA family [Colletotrichum kahawae]|uniref:rRNA methyltransferase 1, mitochondrial n=1 Tax=Colletotrichum kahawae TaxID=34407 RepID=A0AAD9YAV1_COLKA|nr:RNA family [Colletotrichum kahawae]